MSLRDARTRKKRPRTTYVVVVDDPSDAETAMSAAQAEERTALLLHSDDGPDPRLDQARAAVAAARATLLDCVETITFKGIAENAYEAIVAAHPPTADQLAKHAAEPVPADGQKAPPPAWNPDTLIPAVFARCVVPDDGEQALTEQEWASWFADEDAWQVAEKEAAYWACWSATHRPRSVVIPKG